MTPRFVDGQVAGDFTALRGEQNAALGYGDEAERAVLQGYRLPEAGLGVTFPIHTGNLLYLQATSGADCSRRTPYRNSTARTGMPFFPGAGA